MSKRNSALDAIGHMAARPAAPQPAPTAQAEVVDMTGEKMEQAKPAPAARPQRKTVANSYARHMLYLPPKAKKKFKEIAFHEDRKEHDVYIEALREYLERKGYKGLL